MPVRPFQIAGPFQTAGVSQIAGASQTTGASLTASPSHTASPSQTAGAFQIAGTNAERTKAHNRRVVLGHLQGRAGAGRAEIAKASGLTTQTVSNLIAELETEGLVLAAGRRRAARGQPPVVYAFNPKGAAVLGFEVRPD
ncbi:MAG: winged helix-turn-helix transcriptional regulator, partial [Paracoccaceae bacterium]|nr:winged helix-turn-helix transcriptional regulator [Paracoccaceae bacterium]